MQSKPKKLIPKKAYEIEPGDCVLISDDRGDALVRDVYGVGDAAISSKVYIVWDTERWRETVDAVVPADQIVFVFPPSQPHEYRDELEHHASL
jgi:hypothetical protein